MWYWKSSNDELGQFYWSTLYSELSTASKNSQIWFAILSLWGLVDADQRSEVGEKSSRRGAKGRTSGITERKMACLKRKLNHRLTDSSSSQMKNLRTIGGDAGLPAGRPLEYVVNALPKFQWEVKMLQLCIWKLICLSTATTEPFLDSNKT